MNTLAELNETITNLIKVVDMMMDRLDDMNERMDKMMTKINNTSSEQIEKDDELRREYIAAINSFYDKYQSNTK